MIKKRILALVLMFVVCLTMIPSISVSAAKKDKNYSEKETEKLKAEAEDSNVPIFSEWATKDLVMGDRFNIYPLSWYENTLTAPITKEQMNQLVSGFSEKISKAEGVTVVTGSAIEVKDNMTVQEVLNTFYTVLSNHTYTKDIELNDTFGIESFMKENGIFIGKNGERGLTEKCTTEQACVFATRLVTYVYDKLDAASKGFLWKITKNENTIYLLGSIHVADYSLYPFSEDMLTAYEQSDALVVEVNLNDQEGLAAFTSFVYYSDGTTLKDHVSPESYERAVNLAAKYGIPESMVSPLKAWYLSNFFTTMAAADSLDKEAATATALGIDNSFMTDAIIGGKPIQEIEGYEMQGKMFDGFSGELQEYLLNSSMDNLNETLNGTKVTDKSDTLLKRWLSAWQDGDIDSFKNAYNVDNEVLGDTFKENKYENVEELLSEYYMALLTNRDRGMADYIDALLKEEGKNTYFVVVGSLHYLSNYSVLDILEEKGYEINQIN